MRGVLIVWGQKRFVASVQSGFLENRECGAPSDWNRKLGVRVTFMLTRLQPKLLSPLHPTCSTLLAPFPIEFAALAPLH